MFYHFYYNKDQVKRYPLIKKKATCTSITDQTNQSDTCYYLYRFIRVTGELIRHRPHPVAVNPRLKALIQCAC